MSAKNEKIGIVGSGLIGRSWAMLFAAAGYKVVMFDLHEKQLSDALVYIKQQLTDLEEGKLLRGKLSSVEQMKMISTTTSMKQAVGGAKHVQECVPEDLSLKKVVLRKINDHCTIDSTVICSSTSTIMPSKIFENLPRVANSIIAHPCNPPYYCPLTEIVPHPKTSPSTVQVTRDLMEEIGQVPVVVKKEIDGFGLNRIQYAIINEAWNLVKNGIMTPSDVDKIFTTGLGMRYAFMGPFETIHLNAEGTRNYMDRYAPSIRRVSSSFDPVPEFAEQTLAIVDKELSARIPPTAEGLNSRRRWRDERLSGLAKLKKDMDEVPVKSDN